MFCWFRAQKVCLAMIDGWIKQTYWLANSLFGKDSLRGKIHKTLRCLTYKLV